MDKANWVEAFVAAIGQLDQGPTRQRLLDLAEEIWHRFGHLDPVKIAVAAHFLWPRDKGGLEGALGEALLATRQIAGDQGAHR